MSTEESQNSDDRAKPENRGIATSTHLPGLSSIPWNIALKTQDQAHTENSQMKLRHIAEMRIEKNRDQMGQNDDTLPACSSQPDAPELQKSRIQTRINKRVPACQHLRIDK